MLILPQSVVPSLEKNHRAGGYLFSILVRFFAEANDDLAVTPTAD